MADIIGFDPEEKALPTGSAEMIGVFDGTIVDQRDQYRQINPDDWEYKLALKSPKAYAYARVAGDIIPFGLAIFDESRREFEQSSTGEKILNITLDLAVVLPVTKLFKGAKSLLGMQKMGSWMGSKFKPGLTSLSVAEKSIPIGSKFESVSLAEKIKTKWKLSDDEALALVRRSVNPWESLGRSGASTPVEIGKRFKARFTPTGTVTKKTKNQIDYWVKTPLGIQRADHYQKLWIRELKTQTSKSINLTEAFKYQVQDLLGKEAAKTFTLDKASDALMANLFARTLDPTKVITKLFDVGYQWLMPIMTIPTRKIFGMGETLYGTNKIFGNIKGFLGKANKYALQQTVNFEKRLVDAGLGTFKYSKKGSEKIIVGFKKGKELTKERWAQYGKVVREIDDLTAKGASEQVIATHISNNADDVVRKLIFN
ncbi:MAG: hypothetical protein DRN30_00890, partial [Thermoplasmata archaeon]